MGDPLDRDAAAEIIRRASELDAPDVARPDPGQLDRASVEAAAAEVGLSPAAVRRAMAEHDAGALAVSDGGGLLGADRAVVSRTVSLPPHVARPQIDQWLRSQTFEVHRRDGDGVVWQRRDDFVAKVRRKVDLTKKVRLADVDQVATSVVPVDGGGSLVRLVADLGNTRRGLLTGVVAVPAASGPVLGVAATVLMSDPVFLAIGIPAGAALGGLGIVGGRRTLRTVRDEAARTMALFLDDLAALD